MLHKMPEYPFNSLRTKRMATKLEGKTAVALPGDDKLFFTQLGEFSAKFENSLILILVNALSL